jgi:pentose-5-phosphate-3-epimerase
MQLAEILKKIYHFIQLLKKRSCSVGMFTHPAVDLPTLPAILPHADAITVQVS